MNPLNDFRPERIWINWTWLNVFTGCGGWMVSVRALGDWNRIGVWRRGWHVSRGLPEAQR